jgi:phosphate starvation-inducible protein PhoH and related proteins
MRRVTVPERGAEALFGTHDENLRFLEDTLKVRIKSHGSELIVEGQEAGVEVVAQVFDQLGGLMKDGYAVASGDVRLAAQLLSQDGGVRLRDYLMKAAVRGGKKVVVPRSLNQRAYLEQIETHDMVFGIGPAGTGKTYLAVAQAVASLLNKQVARIVLARPAVEAGEKLGFLPGDLQEKVDPYLRPLYDALYDLLDYEKVSRLLERNAIEVAPIAFMRGRAQPLNSHILTHAGWREIGALKVGDCAIGSDGRPTPVLGVYPQGEKEIFRVTATDGASTLCCAEHLWSVKTPEDTRRGKSGRILQTRDMMDRLRRAHQHRYELPMLSGAVRFPESEVPVDPYVLGLLLGDGCLTGTTTPTFATTDLELVESLGAGLGGSVQVHHKAGVDYVLRNALGRRGAMPNPVTVMLRDLGLCGTSSATKFVPRAYLYNTPVVRHAMLQGLLDTDGGPVVQDGRTCRIQYVTNSPELRDAVVFLVRSLGGVAYSRTRTVESKRPGFANGREVAHRADSFGIDIRLPTEFPPFRLSRKTKKYAEDGAGRPMRFIESIEPAGVAETCCIRVGSRDSLYVTDDFLLTHNTLNDAFVIIDEAQNTTTEQMKMVLTRIGFGSKVVVTGDITQIDLPQGKISGLVDAISVLGGVDGISFVYFDEKDVVRHKLVQAVIKAYEAYGAAQTPGK